MDKTKTALKSIDFIGSEIKPTFKGSNTVSTVLGGLLSGVLIIILLAAFFFFGKEMIFRESPITQSYSRINKDLSIPYSMIPVTFSIWSRTGINLTLDPAFESEFSYIGEIFYFTLDNQGNSIPGVISVPFVRCSKEIMGKETAEKFMSYGYDVAHTHCIDISSVPEEDRHIAKSFGVDGSKIIRMFIKFCNPEKAKTCGWSFKEHGNLVLSVEMIDKFVDITDFSNPIKEDLLSFQMPISNGMESNMVISTSKNFLLTDDGYIFSSVKEELYYTINNNERNFSTMSNTARTVAKIRMAVNTKENLIKRSYLKAQELIANLGGFLKGIMFLSKLINFANSDVTLINEITEISRRKKLQTSIPLRINVRAASTSRNNSVAPIKEDISVSPCKITFCEYLRNMICGKLNENMKLKQEAIKCLDMIELIRQRLKIEDIEEKLVNLERR